jgi:hypothetical protein
MTIFVIRTIIWDPTSAAGLTLGDGRELSRSVKQSSQGGGTLRGVNRRGSVFAGKLDDKVMLLLMKRLGLMAPSAKLSGEEAEDSYNKAISVLGKAVFTLDPLVRLTATNTLMVGVDQETTNATRTPASRDRAFLADHLKQDLVLCRDLARRHLEPDGNDQLNVSRSFRISSLTSNIAVNSDEDNDNDEPSNDVKGTEDTDEADSEEKTTIASTLRRR